MALREETFVGHGYLPVGDNDIPVKITINIKDKLTEYMEIDDGNVKSILMKSS
jgi:hypothetical protein